MPGLRSASPAILPVPPALIDVIPPSGIPVGPLTVGFYGVSFVLAVVVIIVVSQSEARRKGLDPGLVTSAIIVVAICAIIGARLYHVIDDWHLRGRSAASRPAALRRPGALRRHHRRDDRHLDLPARARHPPLAGAGHRRARHAPRPGHRPLGQLLQPGALRPPDGPALGHRHRLPAPHRPGARAPLTRPTTTGFQPLFFYESVLTISGGLLALLLSRRFGDHLRDGDLASFWMIWYGSVRLVLEILPPGLELDHPGRAHGRAHRRRPHRGRRGHQPWAPPCSRRGAAVPRAG